MAIHGMTTKHIKQYNLTFSQFITVVWAFSKADPLQAKSLTSWCTVRSLLDDRCNVFPKTSQLASAE